MKLRDILFEIRLEEGKQIGIIYHFTSLNNLFSILKDNTLKGRPALEKEYEFTGDIISKYIKDKLERDKLESFYKNVSDKLKNANVISFTRDRFFYKKERSIDSMEVRIILDGNSLSNSYIFRPYQYEANAGRMKSYVGDESEERCYLTKGNSIQNIKKYINQIDIFENEIDLDKLPNYYLMKDVIDKSPIGLVNHLTKVYGIKFNLVKS